MTSKNRNNGNQNNYKIESLEPRLMMDGNQWGNEILSSGYDVVESASDSYEKWESTKIDSVTLKDENSGEMSFASIKDFLDNENILEKGMNWVKDRVAAAWNRVLADNSPKTLDYSNVWQNSSYTIFDIATDEILSGKTYYFTSNENTNMRTSCGQVGCYKVRDSIHNDLWVQMMFGYGIHKVIIPPAFKLENGLLSITASAEIDDAVDKFYYSINGDPLDFASWTNEYTGPVKVESGDVVHAYIKTAKGYLSTPNSFIVE